MKTVFLFIVVIASSVTWANDLPWKTNKAASEQAKELKDVGIEEHLGSQIDLNLEFTDDRGEKVKLSKYFSDGRPVLMSLVYYSCPNLCNYHLNGVTDTLKEIEWTLGKEFDMVVISIESKEDHTLAAVKKENYVKLYGKPEAAKGWHFLTGTQDNIDKISKQLGFKYRWDETSKQWAHTAAAYAITPKGIISRYIYGISPLPKDLRLGMIEASDGKIGEILDRIVLMCFRYDPDKRTYAFYAYNIVRAGAGLTVLILGLFLFGFWRKERSNRQ